MTQVPNAENHQSPPERLPPNQQLLPQGRWPVVGEKNPGIPPETWTIEIAGQVQHALSWTLDQLRELPQSKMTMDIHCVTRWSRFDMAFEGIPLSDLLELANPTPAAEYVSFVAYSERNHSTSLPLAELKRLRAIVAFSANGEPLSQEHGGPVRVVIEGKYFYKSLKWLRSIQLLPTDKLGYWESDAGYHNGADPWKEERYLAPNLDKRMAAKLIASLDFRDQDLRSLSATERNLAGLNAKGACLRNADFTRSTLTSADFSNANLSNAKLIDANLVDANFHSADIEGADFTGADLTNCCFVGASLFGATFCTENRQSILTKATEFTEQQIAPLTDEQQQFLRRFASVEA